MLNMILILRLDKDPKFQVGDHVRISKHKNVFVKIHTRNWSGEVFVISKMQITVLWIYVINHINRKEISPLEKTMLKLIYLIMKQKQT